MRHKKVEQKRRFAAAAKVFFSDTLNAENIFAIPTESFSSAVVSKLM